MESNSFCARERNDAKLKETPNRVLGEVHRSPHHPCELVVRRPLEAVLDNQKPLCTVLKAPLPTRESEIQRIIRTRLWDSFKDNVPAIEKGWELHCKPRIVAMSSDGDHIATLQANDRVEIVSLETAEQCATSFNGLPTRESPIISLALSSQYLVRGFADGHVDCWHLDTSVLACSWEHDAPVSSMQIHRAVVFTKDRSGEVKIHDVDSKKVFSHSFQSPGPFTISESFLCWNEGAGVIGAWLWASTKIEFLALPSVVEVTCLQLSGSRLAVGCENGWLCQFDVDQPQQSGMIIAASEDPIVHIYLDREFLRAIDSAGMITIWSCDGTSMSAHAKLNIVPNPRTRVLLSTGALLRDDDHGHLRVQRYKSLADAQNFLERAAAYVKRNPQKTKFFVSVIVPTIISAGLYGKEQYCKAQHASEMKQLELRNQEVTRQLEMKSKKLTQAYNETLELTVTKLVQLSQHDPDLTNSGILQAVEESRDRFDNVSPLITLRHDKLESPQGRQEAVDALSEQLKRPNLIDEHRGDSSRQTALAVHPGQDVEQRDLWRFNLVCEDMEVYSNLPSLPNGKKDAEAWAQDMSRRIRKIRFSNTSAGRARADLATRLETLFRQQPALGNSAFLRAHYDRMLLHGNKTYFIPLRDHSLPPEEQIAQEVHNVIVADATQEALARGLMPRPFAQFSQASKLKWMSDRMDSDTGFKLILGDVEPEALQFATQAQRTTRTAISLRSDMDIEIHTWHDPDVPAIARATKQAVMDKIYSTTARNIACEWNAREAMADVGHDQVDAFLRYESHRIARQIHKTDYRETIRDLAPQKGLNLLLFENGQMQDLDQKPLEQIARRQPQSPLSIIPIGKWDPTDAEHLSIRKALDSNRYDTSSMDVAQLSAKASSARKALGSKKLDREIQEVVDEIKRASYARSHRQYIDGSYQSAQQTQNSLLKREYLEAKAKGLPGDELQKLHEKWLKHTEQMKKSFDAVAARVLRDNTGTVAVTAVRHEDDSLGFVVAANQPVIGDPDLDPNPRRGYQKIKEPGLSRDDFDIIQRAFERNVSSIDLATTPVTVVRMSNSWVEDTRRAAFFDSEGIASICRRSSPADSEEIGDLLYRAARDLSRHVMLDLENEYSKIRRHISDRSAQSLLKRALSSAHAVVEHQVHAEMQTLHSRIDVKKILGVYVSKLPCKECRTALDNSSIGYSTPIRSSTNRVGQWRMPDRHEVEPFFQIDLQRRHRPTGLRVAEGPSRPGVPGPFVHEGPWIIAPKRPLKGFIRMLDGKLYKRRTSDRLKRLALTTKTVGKSMARQCGLTRKPQSHSSPSSMEHAFGYLFDRSSVQAPEDVLSPQVSPLDFRDETGVGIGRVATVYSRNAYALHGLAQANFAALTANASATATVADGLSVAAGASLVSASAEFFGGGAGFDLGLQASARVAWHGVALNVPGFGFQVGSRIGVNVVGIELHLDVGRVIAYGCDNSFDWTPDALIKDFDFAYLQTNPNKGWNLILPDITNRLILPS